MIDNKNQNDETHNNQHRHLQEYFATSPYFCLSNFSFLNTTKLKARSFDRINILGLTTLKLFSSSSVFCFSDNI